MILCLAILKMVWQLYQIRPVFVIMHEKLFILCEDIVCICVIFVIVQISDVMQVYDNINSARRGEVLWPNEEWRTAGGSGGWNGWHPSVGDEGTVVHRWIPSHRDPSRRSHTDKTIFLVQIDDKYVPVVETGLTFLGVEV